ncbi:MAG: hypothetical protein MI725_05210 [Pirellulales bacterium]|nr:hypothetical protein [Pirellulales bacterium]
MAVAKAIGAALGSLMLVGCQNMVASSGVYYNVGLAKASNNLLLANVIRAAKGYPNYYSLIGDYSGSTSSSVSPSFDAMVPIPRLGQSANLDVNVSGSKSRDRNANVSSLETRKFTEAMHTQITPKLLAFLIESRDGVHIHLILTMLIKTSRLSLKNYKDIILGARRVCGQRFETLTSAEKGICQNFEAILSDVTCDFAREPSDLGDTFVTLRNDPTNRCAFSQFRMFVEAVMLNRGEFKVDDDGNLDFVFKPTTFAETRSVFDGEGAGVALRSPNGIIHYLGSIVRDQFRRDDAWTPALTTRDGRSVPIFQVRSGRAGRRAAVSAKVDGQKFWIRRQELAAKETDFSYRALTIVKDFQALNTGQEQLPNSPAIILGPGSSLLR